MSLRARALRAVLRRSVLPALARARDPARERTRFDFWAGRFCPPPRGVRVTQAVMGALRLEPAQMARVGTILYFHGGAYLTGSPRSHAGLVGALVARAGVPALLPRYRLAPEHPAPAAFDDALAAWAALIAEGTRPGEVVLGGDSAGGGLALALLAHLCAAGTPPAGAFAFAPWTDLTLSGASLRENAGRDQYLPAHRLAEARDMVLQGLAPEDPRVSPLFAAFPGAPPVQIHVATTEILRDDSRRMTGPLPQADIRQAGDLAHVWPFFHAFLPEARATLDTTAGFVRACLDAST